VAKSAASVEGCTSGTRDRERVGAAVIVAGRADHQPADAKCSCQRGWGRQAGPFSDM